MKVNRIYYISFGI